MMIFERVSQLGQLLQRCRVALTYRIESIRLVHRFYLEVGMDRGLRAGHDD